MFVVYNTTNFRRYETRTGVSITSEKGAKTLCTKLNRKTGESWAWTTAEGWMDVKIPTKKVRNLMSGEEVEISVDTPRCCDPSSETYWSM